MKPESDTKIMGPSKRATPDERRATIVGVVLILLAVFTFWVFGLGSEAGAESTFKLSLPLARYEGLSWSVNTQWVAFLASAVWIIAIANAFHLLAPYSHIVGGDI